MEMKELEILVMLPALNEEKTIGDVLDKIGALKISGASIKMLVVNDGSNDRTVEIAEEKGAQVVSHIHNRGVGAAFQSGLKTAIFQGADILVNIDSDGQFDPANIPDLINPLMEGKADFVTASRFVVDDSIVMPGIKKWGNRQIARIVSLLSRQKIHDVSCGFRAYSRKAFTNLNLIGSFTYTHESILALAFRGFVIKEVSVPVRGTREFGSSRVASNLFKYAFSAMLIIIRAFRDYKPMLTFGIPGVLFLMTGMLMLLLFFGWSFMRGEWFPKSMAFTSGFFILSGMLFFLVALIADMFTRIRVKLETLMEYVYNNR